MVKLVLVLFLRSLASPESSPFNYRRRPLTESERRGVDIRASAFDHLHTHPVPMYQQHHYVFYFFFKKKVHLALLNFELHPSCLGGTALGAAAFIRVQWPWIMLPAPV